MLIWRRLRAVTGPIQATAYVRIHKPAKTAERHNTAKPANSIEPKMVHPVLLRALRGKMSS